MVVVISLPGPGFLKPDAGVWWDRLNLLGTSTWWPIHRQEATFSLDSLSFDLLTCGGSGLMSMAKSVISRVPFPHWWVSCTIPRLFPQLPPFVYFPPFAASTWQIHFSTLLHSSLFLLFLQTSWLQLPLHHLSSCLYIDISIFLCIVLKIGQECCQKVFVMLLWFLRLRSLA